MKTVIVAIHTTGSVNYATKKHSACADMHMCAPWPTFVIIL